MITIVIPSYSRAAVLTGVIAALRTQTVFNKFACEIIVSVDKTDPDLDAYTDYINQFIEIYKQSVSNVELKLLINNSKGLIHAKNAAVKSSKFNYIMMLDDDLILEPNYIEELYNDIIKDNKIGGVSGYIVTFKPAISHTQPSNIITELPESNHLQTLEVNENSGEWRSVFGKKEQVQDWSEINKQLEESTRYTMDYFVNSYLFKKEVFNLVNGYNPDLNSNTSAHEEVDFTFRVRKEGYTLLFNPFVRMWHWTIGKGGIYKGKDWDSSKLILEKEYKDSLGVFIKSVSK